MANAKEIRNRIKSVKDTQKITNAMYLIASTKMRKAKSDLDNTRPYFEAVRGEIRRVFRTVDGVAENRYFYREKDENPDAVYGCLVITADKGLAGAYNMNVIKKTEELIRTKKNIRLFVVGEYGRQYFMQHKIPIEESFQYTAQNPNLDRARDIGGRLLELFDDRQIDELFVIYTDMVNSMVSEPKLTRVLPFHRYQIEDEGEIADNTIYEFFPSAQAVLENAIESYTGGFVYSALVDSFCAEQNARMTAMKSANDNAEKILAELSIQYNRVRQAAITQEITEVSAGAKAQKRKRMKMAYAREEMT